ncbi:MAG: sulfotransferase [bacterium]|nr:sulfotransferase [bacterium]
MPETMSLNYDEAVFEEMAAIKDEAAAKTGCTDFGDPSFEGPLLAWVHDLGNPKINDFGRKFLRRLAVRDLCRRLDVLAYLKEHPEILDVEVPPIVFITGAARTGSTLLHNLMATHPDCRPLLRWELMDPLPPPQRETYATDPRIAKLQASIEPLRGSRLEKMHWVDADEPDENTWGFLDCTGMLGRGVTPLMKTWTRWMEENDLSPTYRDFRKLVQLLIWKCPPPPGGHLVLKCVMTTMKVAQFADVFPEARFVLAHRDPYRSLVSSCATGEAICQAFVADGPGPLHEDGLRDQQAFGSQKMALQALVELARFEPARVVNVRYADLMASAVESTRSTYERLGMDAPEGLEERIIGFLEKQRGGKRAAPPSRIETFGYEADAVWCDPTVAKYCETFGVKPERSRKVDTLTGS